MKLTALLLMVGAGVAVGQNGSVKGITPGTGITLNTAPPVDVTVGVEIKSHTGTVVKLSDEEYARLQKLRQAVADAEMEIARMHGVYFATPIDLNFRINTCDRIDGCPPKPTDHFEFRGQYLLINVPKSTTK